jgi:hypothetical protein
MAFTETPVLVPGENHDSKAVSNDTHKLKWLLHFKSPCNSNKAVNILDTIIEVKTRDIPDLTEEHARRMKHLV